MMRGENKRRNDNSGYNNENKNRSKNSNKNRHKNKSRGKNKTRNKKQARIQGGENGRRKVGGYAALFQPDACVWHLPTHRTSGTRPS